MQSCPLRESLHSAWGLAMIPTYLVESQFSLFFKFKDFFHSVFNSRQCKVLWQAYRYQGFWIIIASQNWKRSCVFQPQVGKDPVSYSPTVNLTLPRNYYVVILLHSFILHDFPDWVSNQLFVFLRQKLHVSHCVQQQLMDNLLVDTRLLLSCLKFL